VAFNLRLPESLRKARWKVKIRDKEIAEHPHITIIRGTRAWRFNLRASAFMDDDPDPAEVPKELIAIITEPRIWELLRETWDRMYPNNPVSGSASSQGQPG
jgi:hypothetical protein